MGYSVPVESIYLSERDVFMSFYAPYGQLVSFKVAVPHAGRPVPEGISFTTSVITSKGGRVKVILKMEFFILVSYPVVDLA